MIKRFLIITSILFMMNGVYAGVYEDAVAKSTNVFLYLYTKNCKTCKTFDSIYDNLKNNNKDFEFVKVDAETLYGFNLMVKMHGRYVPYIILANAKTKKIVNINHSCVMDEVCILRAMKSFKS